MIAVNNFLKNIKLNSASNATKLLRANQLQKKLNRHFRSARFSLEISKELQIPLEVAQNSIGIFGLKGTGREQLEVSLLQQIRSIPGQKGVIFDKDGYFYSRLGNENDTIVSLGHRESEGWDFWSEGMPPEYFAEIIIRNEVTFYSKAAQLVFADLIENTENIQQMREIVNLPTGEFAASAAGKRSGELLQTSSLGIEMIQSLIWERTEFLFQLSLLPKNNSFTISNWCNSDEEEWLFLMGSRPTELNPRRWEIEKPILRTWFDLALRRSALRNTESNSPHFWVFANDLPAIGILPNLSTFLEFERRSKLSAIFGSCSVSELASLDSLPTQIAGRINDDSTARLLGVLPNELAGLDDLQAYVKVRDFGLTRVEFANLDMSLV